MTCPRTHVLQVTVFGLQQSFYVFQSNTASQNHRVSCQTLQTSPFCASILRRTIFPQLTIYGITLLSVQRAKPQAKPHYWVIHFDKEVGKADSHVDSVWSSSFTSFPLNLSEPEDPEATPLTSYVPWTKAELGAIGKDFPKVSEESHKFAWGCNTVIHI